MTKHKHACRCLDCIERVEDWNNMHRAVLPTAPLVEVLNRVAPWENVGTDHDYDGYASMGGLKPLLSPAESQALYRAIRSGRISRAVADTLACRLSLHPADIWPDWWAA